MLELAVAYYPDVTFFATNVALSNFEPALRGKMTRFAALIAG